MCEEAHDSRTAGSEREGVYCILQWNTSQVVVSTSHAQFSPVALDRFVPFIAEQNWILRSYITWSEHLFRSGVQRCVILNLHLLFKSVFAYPWFCY